MREVGVQDEEDYTGQEGQDTYSNSKVAGSSIGIEHALEFLVGSYIHVAFCCNGCKHHDREHLQEERTGWIMQEGSMKTHSESHDSEMKVKKYSNF